MVALWLQRLAMNQRICGQVSVLGSVSSAEDCSSLKCLDPEQLLVACYAADPEPELGYL